MPDQSELHIPTDLFGLAPATYRSDRTDGNLQAALGPACHQIRKTIQKLGVNASPFQTDEIQESSIEYDDSDILVILEAWLENEAQESIAISYSDVDTKLNLPNGSTKKFITALFERNTHYQLELCGKSVFKFSEPSGLSSYLV